MIGFIQMLSFQNWIRRTTWEKLQKFFCMVGRFTRERKLGQQGTNRHRMRLCEWECEWERKCECVCKRLRERERVRERVKDQSESHIAFGIRAMPMLWIWPSLSLLLLLLFSSSLLLLVVVLLLMLFDRLLLIRLHLLRFFSGKEIFVFSAELNSCHL